MNQIETDELFDLLIKGGEVLDPSQDLQARRDIGIKNELIAELAPQIPTDRGARGQNPHPLLYPWSAF